MTGEWCQVQGVSKVQVVSVMDVWMSGARSRSQGSDVWMSGAGCLDVRC